MRIFDFLNVLGFLTVFCAIMVFVDWFIRRYRTGHTEERKFSLLVEYARAFFPVFLIVLVIRSFVFQPFRVPSGSLEPTVMPGDLIFVTQYNYGLKVPIWDTTVIPVGKPKRGQIALFRWPVNQKMTFVKRVIGLPGDHISYVNKVFTINGRVETQKLVGDFQEDLGAGRTQPVKEYIENLDGIKHYIIRNPNIPAQNFKDLVVPKGMYMMIGDNRDNSDDSRDWGFVPQEYYIGRALFVWFNIQFAPFSIKWNRIGTKLFGSL